MVWIPSSIVRSITNNYEDLSGFNTYSARFHDKELDEGRFIDIVTNHKGINPINIWPDEHTLYEELDKVYYHQEEPFQSSSIFAQWEVMKSAYKNGTTVLLDGQGADEVIAGYSYYYPVFLRELYFSDKKRLESEVTALEKIHQKQIMVSKASLVESSMPRVFSAARELKWRFHF